MKKIVNTTKIFSLDEIQRYPRDGVQLVCDKCGGELDYSGLNGNENVDGMYCFYWMICKDCERIFRYIPLLFQVQPED